MVLLTAVGFDPPGAAQQATPGTIVAPRAITPSTATPMRAIEKPCTMERTGDRALFRRGGDITVAPCGQNDPRAGARDRDRLGHDRRDPLPVLGGVAVTDLAITEQTGCLVVNGGVQ